MESGEIASQMMEHITGQVALFQEMCQLQTSLLQRIDSGEPMSAILGLLTDKNNLLDQVRIRNQNASEVVSAWPKIRETIADKQIVIRVNQLLDELEAAVKQLREKDEQMLKRVQAASVSTKPEDRAKHSQNVMNAFRAMR